MLQFLQNLEPSMELLFLKFEAECFNDKMLQTVISWPDEDINKLLRDLTAAGIMSTIQCLVVKKGLVAMCGPL